MSARYRKIDPRVWVDEKFRRLSSLEKLIAIYSITAQSNRLGFFHFSPARAAEDLETEPEIFQQCFLKVLQTLRWQWDPQARVLYIPTWFKYNPPENPNVLKGSLGDLHDVPKTGLFGEFSSDGRYLREDLRETFLQTLAQARAEPYANQEQEQEQDQKQELVVRESLNGGKSQEGLPSQRTCRKPPVDCQKIIDLWNSTVTRLPKVSKITPKREKQIAVLLDNYSIPELGEIFRRLDESDFAANGNWSSLDWLLKSITNCEKVRDGNYDNNRSDNSEVHYPSVDEVLSDDEQPVDQHAAEKFQDILTSTGKL